MMTPTKRELTPEQKKAQQAKWDKHQPPFIKVLVERVPGAQRRLSFTHDVYNVRLLDGSRELIVTMSASPAHDACRALQERGVTGTLEIWHPKEAYAAARIAIAPGAKYTTVTGTDGKPRTVKFQKFEEHLKERFKAARDSDDGDGAEE